ncbi:S8 family serine peptidase [Rheinheimera pleomorphica]|uniref:S8 family serine peptidase n=1 Tax=Rheinheimera pleomorphica TaxID=2703963 RepID=UPI0014201E57|nr:S8 family serine peptidase [Rheinheimera pleomorphica]
MLKQTMLRQIMLALVAAASCSVSAASAPVRLIITLEQGASADSLSAVRAADASHGQARELRTFAHLPQLAVASVPSDTPVPQALAQYRQMPGVKAVELDHKVRKTQTSNDPLFNQQWHLNADNGINAVAAWDSTTGDEQVVIAVIDTGIDYLHQDLAANIWQNPAEITGDGIDNDNNGYIDDIYGINPADDNVDPMDEDGHGTLVAGIIGARGNNNLGVAGINWQVKLLPCRFMDVNGDGFISDAIACLDYLLDLKQNHGVNIVASNNSWGSPSYSQALYNAIAAHHQAGILFIASAGNDNTQAAFYPAAFDLPNIISVSAHQQSGAKAGFANYGRHWVDLSAPGVAIYATDLADAYSQASGTSMSAPMVSAVAGLLKAAEPSLNAAQLRARLLVSGVQASDDTLAQQTSTGRLLLASGDNQSGALNCVNAQLQRRVKPLSNQVFLAANTALELQVLSLDCDGNSIATSVTQGDDAQPLALNDAGQQFDRFADDGLHSGSWTFDGNNTVLNFPDGQVQVQLRNDDFCMLNNVSEIPQAECAALVQLYYDTQGQDWLNQQNWLQTATPCNWHGVSCSAGRVTSLVLDDNGLVGQLPDSLNQLSELTELDLSFNALQGSFPPALLQLTKLQRLQLWNNAFDGAIPPALANLTELVALDLSFNRFSGALPSGLGNLPQLRELFVENNFLSGAVPSTLGQLSQLQILWLENNDFSGTLPQSLIELSQLQSFSFAGTDVCAPANAGFGSWLAQLEVLEINTDCANTAPQVSAGSAQTVSSGTTVQLSASATDAEFNVLSYQWQQLSGPAVSLSEPEALTSRFTAPVVSNDTQLRFRFTADDGISQSSAEVSITVRATAGSGSSSGGTSGGSMAVLALVLLVVLFALRLGNGALTAYNAGRLCRCGTA